jgi:predicted Zn-dependent peptidase
MKLPQIQKRQFANGLPVWIVELHEVPVVQADLIVESGAADDPQGEEGLASLAADMLDEGAGTRDALALADAIDFLGAELTTGASFNSTAVRLHVPVARLGEALPLMADVALRPTFPERELERLRKERLTALQQARDEPESIVESAFARVVFGAHRYGTGAAGTSATIRGLTLEDLRGFHARAFRPSNATLLVVGDVTPDAVVPMLERAFGSWDHGAHGEHGESPRDPRALRGDRPRDPRAPRGELPAPPQLKARRLVLVDKPGAAQSQIRIGWVGVPRSTPDYFAIQVLNTILGGAFTSRLNQNLREQHGYSYGAFSAFDMRRAAGPFFAGAGVQTDKTAEALREFFKELNGILAPIPADELAKAKNSHRPPLPAQLRDDEEHCGATGGDGRVRSAGRLFRDVRRSGAGGHGGRRPACGEGARPAGSLRGRRRGRQEGDRGAGPRAQSGADQRHVG